MTIASKSPLSDALSRIAAKVAEEFGLTVVMIQTFYDLKPAGDTSYALHDIGAHNWSPAVAEAAAIAHLDAARKALMADPCDCARCQARATRVAAALKALTAAGQGPVRQTGSTH